MALGLATPLACSMVTGVMTGAIAKVHYQNGFWSSNKGFEYNLHILAATFAIAGAGGGALTLDGLRGKKRRGFGWALAQLVIGAGAGWGALALAERKGYEGTASQLSPGPRDDDKAVDLTSDHDQDWSEQSETARSMS